jgi:dTDP-4-amino-4,6-dideoxygalactose transaminase
MPSPFPSPIYVTRPYLPPLEEFCEGLREIWDNQWLTNNGPVLQRYRQKLENFVGSPNVSLFANGTLALQIALQGLKLTGEVITTPFTFVATTHALTACGLDPVFIDIEPETYTLDPEKVEAAITPRTSAILAVHVYGYPCDLEALADIAGRHGLRLVYDAAHAFGVRIDGQSIAQFGDVSMFSFHATKLYHSIEGGMLVFADPDWKQTFDDLKNFGFRGETEVVAVGTNAKMNEFQALMGELALQRIDEIIANRAAIHHAYVSRLRDMPGLRLPPPPAVGVRPNYAYFPIAIDPAAYGATRDDLYARLRQHNVFARRYFYPLICDLACYRDIPLEHPLDVARGVASQIITLPIYHGLALEDVDRICDLVETVADGAFDSRLKETANEGMVQRHRN